MRPAPPSPCPPPCSASSCSAVTVLSVPRAPRLSVRGVQAWQGPPHSLILFPPLQPGSCGALRGGRAREEAGFLSQRRKGKRSGSIRPSPGAAQWPAGELPYGQEWLLEASWVGRECIGHTQALIC